jgi:hypothetical protein
MSEQSMGDKPVTRAVSSSNDSTTARLPPHHRSAKMKRIFFEVVSAAFLACGAVGVVGAIESIKVDFSKKAHKGSGVGLAERIPTWEWILVSVVLLSVAFHVSHHARRLRRTGSRSPHPGKTDTE